MKKAILLLVLLMCILPVRADLILTGGVDYTVKSAREELLNEAQTQIDLRLIVLNIYDVRHQENIKCLLKGETSLKDRTLASFSDSTYAVMYNSDKFHVWYYSNEGILLYAEKKDGIGYPYKSFKYDINGKLVNMGLRVSKGETFIYTPNGKLLAHWVDSKGYDEFGKIVMTREYYE